MSETRVYLTRSTIKLCVLKEYEATSTLQAELMARGGVDSMLKNLEGDLQYARITSLAQREPDYADEEDDEEEDEEEEDENAEVEAEDIEDPE